MFKENESDGIWKGSFFEVFQSFPSVPFSIRFIFFKHLYDKNTLKNILSYLL